MEWGLTKCGFGNYTGNYTAFCGMMNYQMLLLRFLYYSKSNAMSYWYDVEISQMCEKVTFASCLYGSMLRISIYARLPSESCHVNSPYFFFQLFYIFFKHFVPYAQAGICEICVVWRLNDLTKSKWFGQGLDSHFSHVWILTCREQKQ